jgi:hypothetical protein
MKSLAEDEARFKSELSCSNDDAAGRSRVSAATENQVEYDGEEQRASG